MCVADHPYQRHKGQLEVNQAFIHRVNNEVNDKWLYLKRDYPQSWENVTYCNIVWKQQK